VAGLNDTSSRDLPAPLAAPAPDGEVTRPAKPIPVWLRLRWEDGTERTVKGFAFAWSADGVLVQYLGEGSYHLTAREIWTEALNVTRRKLEPQWLGRER
jgi:hypothetical protein